MKQLMLILLALAFIGSFAIISSCDDDDDDDDNDTSFDDDDDDDSSADGICKNGELIDPLPNEGMIPSSDCTSCHFEGGGATIAHDGQYDDSAPGSCMAIECHACPF